MQQANAQAIENSNKYIRENISSIAIFDPLKPELISESLNYLLSKWREKRHQDNARMHHDWQVLSQDFGPEVAKAFRDAVVAYWHRYTPPIISDDCEEELFWPSDLVGLCGIAIEANEVPGWPNSLTEDEAAVAFRYALFEMNGFPSWLPKLYAGFTSVIDEIAWLVISHELTSNTAARKESNYLLYDVGNSGEWLWNSLAPGLYEFVKKYDVVHTQKLGLVISVLQGATVISDQDLASLAYLKSQTSFSTEAHAYWAAVWTGVDPVNAITHLESFLEAEPDPEVAKVFSLTFITQLMGDRFGGSTNTRELYITPQSLKRLYLLMIKFINPAEDNDRTDGKVYSVNIRDDAETGRNRLYELLTNIPGKEGYQALHEVAEEHPDEKSKPWLKQRATNRATKDADIPEWTIPQILEFYKEQEATPSCHQDLFQLAEFRMLDLKDDLEHGDSSVANGLIQIKEEVEIRKFIGNWFRETSRGRYTITQEEEMADAKRPDFRLHGNGFDAPIPMELKLADNWTGPGLFERLKVQLNEDYLRDRKSTRGLFVLVNRDKDRVWVVDEIEYNFENLVEALQNYWLTISPEYPKVEEIKIVGVDLTKRGSKVRTKSKAKGDKDKK